MFKGERYIIVMLFFTVIFSFTIKPRIASAEIYSSSPKFDFVALGDSLAAGQTPECTFDKSYTTYIEDKLKEKGVLGDFNNFAVSGYKTSDVLKKLQDPTQLNIIKNAEIITLDVGANDLLSYISPSMANSTDNLALAEIIATITKEVPQNIITIIAEIREVNPTAKIYVMGYYNSFPYLSSPLQDQALYFIQALNNSIKTTTESCGATYVSTEEVMNKQLTEYIPNPADIHPSLLGYQAIAKEFLKIIEVDFRLVQN